MLAQNPYIPNPDSDWVIPGDHLTHTETDFADDFVIGQDLLIGLDREGFAQNRDPDLDHLDEMMLDLTEVVEEFPFVQKQDGAVNPWSNLAISDKVELLDDTLIPGSILDESTALELSEVQGLNQRIFNESQGLWNMLSAADSISTEELQGLRSKVILDRDLLDEQNEKVQAWINRFILQGDLEQMHQVNKVKHALYETQSLLRRLEQEYFPQENPVDGHEPVDMEVGSLAGNMNIDVPEFSHTPFTVPIRKEARGARKKSQQTIERSGFRFDFQFEARRVKVVALFLLICMVPVSYLMSASRISVKRTKVEPYQYSTILPMEKAYRVKDNFVGQVKEDWITLSKDEKQRQMRDLVNVIKNEGYTIVALYYPNGQPAANFILGSVIIY